MIRLQIALELLNSKCLSFEQQKIHNEAWEYFKELTKVPEVAKNPVQDLSDKYCLDDCKRWMEVSIVDDVRCDTEHGRCGDDERSEVFKFQGKFYKITVEIEWNRYDKQFYYVDGSRVLSCEEVEYDESL